MMPRGIVIADLDHGAVGWDGAASGQCEYFIVSPFGHVVDDGTTFTVTSLVRRYGYDTW